MDKTMKERIEAFIKTHQWCIIVIMIILTFCWIKSTVDGAIIDYQQQKIEKYQSLYIEQSDVYWKMVDERNYWRNRADSLRRIVLYQ